MPRLCSESQRPYPGRSAQRAMISCCLINDQSGHWYIKPGRIDTLSVDTSEIDSKENSKSIAHHMETYDVIGQKSAEVIVVECSG